MAKKGEENGSSPPKERQIRRVDPSAARMVIPGS
jgi:hypothetical protein